MKFTAEIKENWLNALKSGKYKQGFGRLYNPIDNTHCCIGVLGEVTEGLSCKDSLSENSSENPYTFLRQTIVKDKTGVLWSTNDSGEFDDHIQKARDYSNVIPLIESLPTQE